jgi:tRNA-binding protein
MLRIPSKFEKNGTCAAPPALAWVSIQGYTHSVETIEWKDFERVELRAGTIVAAEEFPEARKPAYKLTVDFGELGIRRSSAQVTTLYKPEDLVGMQVVAVLNFPPKRIAGFVSECLVTGFPDADGNVSLVTPTHRVPNGAKLF